MTDPLIIAAGQLMLASGPQPGRPVCFCLIQAWILSFSSGTEEKVKKTSRSSSQKCTSQYFHPIVQSLLIPSSTTKEAVSYHVRAAQDVT